MTKPAPKPRHTGGAQHSRDERIETIPASDKAKMTNLETSDDLTVYDLDPQASELWAVAGPSGVDPKTIDPDNLPTGFRWISNEEFEAILDAADSRYGMGCE